MITWPWPFAAEEDTRNGVEEHASQDRVKPLEGAAGKTATHGVVQARLMLEGKDFGPHLFFVQLRSLGASVLRYMLTGWC